MAFKKRETKPDPELIAGLTKAYWMELETVMNYISNSIDLDGVRAEEIKKSLQLDIQAELGHAQSLARRIKELGGRVPGSMEFRADQKSLQPPRNSTDVKTVIRGVIDAENAAIDHYNALIRLSEGKDYVTQDLCITLLADEEAHRREFRGFLLEYTSHRR
jgi:bacterioferritin